MSRRFLVWASRFARRLFGGFPSAHGMSERVPFSGEKKGTKKFADSEARIFGGQLARVISY